MNRNLDAASRTSVSPSPTGFTVIALIAAYNEEDIIGQVIGYLVGQGVEVYLLDHASTDGTVAEAEPYLGRGLLQIERFTEGEAAGTTTRVSWAAILKRKEELARELAASWFIHHDADEFRESPWPHLNLLEAIRFVDRLGYNAIDFQVFNFPPTRDGLTGRDDFRAAFQHYTPAAAWDRVQIKAWKKTMGPIDLVTSGGHEGIFAGRRVFPVRFILRHYPIRSQAHGTRKVLEERKARFAEEEHRQGWHVQYDSMDENYNFIRDPRELVEYDADQARLHVMVNHRGLEELEPTPALRDQTIDQLRRSLDVLDGHLDQQNHLVEELQRDLDQQNHLVEELHRALDERTRLVARQAAELDARNRKIEELEHNLNALGHDVTALHWQLDQRNHEVETLTCDVDAGHREVRALRQQIESREQDAEDLRRELDAHGKELARLRAAVGDLGRRLEDVYASRSWRWTAPLRLSLRFLRGH
jgi:predicted  nucleic acid-binding Zn-ribbon protein